MAKNIKIFLFLGFLALCVSCSGSIYENEPVGHGKDPSEPKISPCACLKIEMLEGLPDWFVNS